MKHTIFVVLTFFISVTHVLAFDYGAVANGQFITEKIEETSAKGKVTLAPWFSLPFDMPVLGTSDFHASLGLSTILGGKLQFIPELFRLELAVQPLPALAVRAGRIPWQDPSRLVVKGAFDGIDAQYTFRKFSIGASALYTGFLYKDTANINSSPGDTKDYSVDFSFGEFGATYFAPRRLVASLYGEVPGFLFERGHLYAGLLAQFDLSGAEERYHTQYLLLRYTFVYKAFSLAAAGTAGLANTTADGMQVSFAASVDASLLLPTSWDDRFSLGFRWASGSSSRTAAFFPLIREAQGVAFKPVFSGIMIIRPLYEVRIHQSLSAELGGRYFIRTDSKSYSDPHLNTDSYLLGAELDGTVLWVPFSDLSFSLTGGIFLPQTGKAFTGGTPVRWSITLGSIFSL